MSFSYFDSLDSKQQTEVVAQTTVLMAPKAGHRNASKMFEAMKESLAKELLGPDFFDNRTSLTITNNTGAVSINGNAIVCDNSSNKRKAPPETNEQEGAAEEEETPTTKKRFKPHPPKSIASCAVVNITENKGSVSVNGDAIVAKESKKPSPPSERKVMFMLTPEQEGRVSKSNDTTELAMEVLDAARYYKNKASRLTMQRKHDKKKLKLLVEQRKLLEEQRDYEKSQAVHYRNDAIAFRNEIKVLKSQNNSS